MFTVKNGGARWLLLLPPSPTELTLHALHAAYGPGLKSALKDASLATNETSTRTILDIGVAHRAQSRSDFASLQHLFGILYKLTCIICTEQNIDLQYDNDVDTRFFLFDCCTDGALPKSQEKSLALLSFQQIAQSRRPWSRICALESKVGEDLLQEFFCFRREISAHSLPDPTISRLPEGLYMTEAAHLSPESEASPSSPSRHHCSVAVGGTFDHLHAGHKLLLTMTAFALFVAANTECNETMCLTVGITGDELLKKKQYIEELENWDLRQASVKAFLLDVLEFIPPRHIHQQTQCVTVSASNGREVIDVFQSGLHVRYTEIFDPFGPTITDPNITALVISAETRSGGDAVNSRRQEKDWAPLEVLEIGILDTEVSDAHSKSNSVQNDFQNKLSSTEIRARIHKKRTMASGSR
ncbi:MAG: hypothetical protein Q9163_002089 [Psora crenata]